MEHGFSDCYHVCESVIFKDLPCLCFCHHWATWDTDWFLQECLCRSHRYYAKSCPAFSPFLAQSRPCWLCSAGILVAEAVLLTAMAMGCLWIYWRPTWLVYRARTEGLHYGRLCSAAVCHLKNVMHCITHFFILRMPVCSGPNFGVPILLLANLFTYKLRSLAEVTIFFWHFQFPHPPSLLGRFMNPLFGLKN